MSYKAIALITTAVKIVLKIYVENLNSCDFKFLGVGCESVMLIS